MSRKRFAVALAAIAVAAFAGRLVYIFTVTNGLKTPSLTSSWSGPVRSLDELYYRNAAARVGDGDGFRVALFGPDDSEDAYHPPLTYVALAPVSWASRDSAFAMRTAVALAGVGVVVLAGLVARHLAGERAGLTAAVLAAVYPNLWMNDGLIMSETFATLTAAATVLLAYLLRSRPSWWKAAATGLACGLAMLARSELALLLPLLAVPTVLLLPGAAVKRRLLLAGVVVGAAALPVAPWVAYNMSRFERPVLITTGYGDALIGANCDGSYSGPEIGLHDGRCGLGGHAEQSVDADEKRRQALRYMADHVERLPVVWTARLGRMWSLYRPFEMAELTETEGKPRWASLLGLAMYWPLLALGVCGAVALRRRGLPSWPVLAPIAVVVITAVAFWGLVRFRATAEPSLVVLAAVGLATLVPRLGLAGTHPRTSGTSLGTSSV